MEKYRVLIVDDKREVSRMLRSALEQLEVELEVTDVLSGEEAILELTRGPIDLLISDSRLPGMTGFQVMERFQKHNPGTKIFLISGGQEPKLRQQVAQAGADAFFFKPIEIADFLDSVERNLGMVDSILPNEMAVARDEMEEEQTTPGMTDRITNLRNELEASAVLLVSDRGQVLVRAGDLPSPEIEHAILPELSAYLEHAGRISRIAGALSPRTFLTINGKNYDIHLTHVGEAYALLATTQPLEPRKLAETSNNMLNAAADVFARLAELGVAPEVNRFKTGSLEPKPSRVEPSPSMPLVAPDTSPSSKKEDGRKSKKEAAKTREEKPIPAFTTVEKLEDLSDPELEAVLANTDGIKLKDADDFWEQSAKEVTAADLSSTDSLSYEQALKLGLTPPNGDE
jgi:CheY-like chemotaxis protein